MDPHDRFLKLIEPGATLNGIDFVEVDENDATVLRVHFINAVAVGDTGKIASIDGGDSVPTVALKDVVAGDWGSDAEGRPLLTLHCLNAGDFSNYTLHLKSAALDRYFIASVFTFKVFCPSDFDCAPVPPPCPPDDTPLPPIDYLAKDFLSFRRALSDFSALRYPDWRERSEADFGVMFMEALSALADDYSYQQDRIAAESALDTATERRSVVQHARLVDYEPRPATCARTWLTLTVNTTAVPAGVLVFAPNPDGGSVPFEIGEGLADSASYLVDPRWNGPIKAYWLDDKSACLPRGATEMWVAGDNHQFYVGQALLIETGAANPADPPLRQIVHLIAPDPTNPSQANDTYIDQLFPAGGTHITRIVWSASEAITHERDLTNTSVRGNIVPATQGQRYSESFAIGAPPTTSPFMPLAFARLGPNATPKNPTYTLRYCLANAPLAWLATGNPDNSDLPPAPEIRLTHTGTPSAPWPFMPRLIEAEEGEPAFCLEAARYTPIARHADGTAQLDYDGSGGDTIRFGDGAFGAMPDDGDVFAVDYRVGAGAAGNVAADAITDIDPAWRSLVNAVSNPFPATGGADAETNEQVRRRAPQAFRARQYRAVRAEDYETEAERLAWVQQAGTTFRWTGSWFTVFTAIDPKGGAALPLDRQIEMVQLLNRRRLCGYESYVPPPRYVSIDLAVTLCAKPDAFQGTVERDVLDALTVGGASADDFFFADHFTFGTPLERSRLEAAIQNVPGVAGVLSIQYRRRAVVPDYVDLPDSIELATDEILRVDNDPDYPERGSISVTVMGGR
ncbi:MAG TPA: baseplate J/gp47 family protein [Pseudolabrys sp.]|nr:baseplate J/gp47 family protein [Pseudolabrys sp.]